MSETKKAVFGGGCFWCIEPVFSRVKGVNAVEPGYTGGHVKNPSYQEVCMGNTGHAEVIKIEFDPQVVSYSKLLEIFFSVHDPTTLNRQGADIGDQYRSAIFYEDEKQKKEVEDFVKVLEEKKVFKKPIVTKIERLTDYYSAEDYHRQYYDNNPGLPYCQFIITPKIKKLSNNFGDILK